MRQCPTHGIPFNLPNGEFIVEFSTLPSRFDIRVEFHQ